MRWPNGIGLSVSLNFAMAAGLSRRGFGSRAVAVFSAVLLVWCPETLAATRAWLWSSLQTNNVDKQALSRKKDSDASTN